MFAVKPKKNRCEKLHFPRNFNYYYSLWRFMKCCYVHHKPYILSTSSTEWLSLLLKIFASQLCDRGKFIIIDILYYHYNIMSKKTKTLLDIHVRCYSGTSFFKPSPGNPATYYICIQLQRNKDPSNYSNFRLFITILIS